MVGAVVLVWATGGFGTDAKPFLGTRVQTGEKVETRFWDVTVHDAQVFPEKGEIHVAITAVNKGRDTHAGLTYNMLVIRLPDGTPMLRSTCVSARGRVFAPLIPAEAQCVFEFMGNEVPEDSIPGPGPFDIEFIVLDQDLSDDLLLSSEPQAGDAVAWTPLRVAVAPEES